MLSVGPMRPLVTATSLGGARRDDDCGMQIDSLSDEWSVESWTAESRHETCCARLDDFYWVIPACDLVGRFPRPEGDEVLSDIEQDVCDAPDEFPVSMETAAVESLCFPVVVQTRLQEGCDPVLPLPMCKGQEFLVEDGPDVIVSGRESIITESDVSCEICVVSDQFPVVVPKLASVPLAVSVVAQTRPRVGCGPDLPLLVDKGMQSLDDDGLDIIISGRESTMMISDVSRDICVEPDQLPVVVSKEVVEPLALPVVTLTRSQVGCTPVVAWPANDDMILQVGVDPDLLSGWVMKSVDPDVESGDQVLLKVVPDVDWDACHTEWREMVVDDMVTEKFVLVPEVFPVGSMMSAAEPTFLPAFSEVYSLVVLAGGGGELLRQTPGGGGVRYSASVCPASCRKRISDGLCWEGRLGFGRFEGWPVMSPNGLGGNPAGFAGRAKRDGLCRSGRNPGR